jgi:uncharacterized membrane protein YdjX (TVP38/TMEM64 family)
MVGLVLLAALLVTHPSLAADLDPSDSERGLLAYWDLLWDFLKTTHPGIFFVAMAFLPIAPVPMSPFYLLGPTLYGQGPFMFGTAIALVVNMMVAYWVASGALRPLVEKLFDRLGYRVPELKADEANKLTVVVRVTPGIPYFIQNLSLGLAGIPFRNYMLISWPIQMCWAFAFGILGESAFEGNAGVGAAAVGGIVALVMITGWRVAKRVWSKTPATSTGAQASERRRSLFSIQVT